MKKLKKDLFLLLLASFFLTFFIWLPFLLGKSEGMLTVFKNFDGPNYIVVAKSWYSHNLIAKNFSLPAPLEYYPAHFPGYPLSIFFFNLFLKGPNAMLVSTFLFGVLAVFSFYLFLLKFKLSQNPFWLSIVFLVLPARWVVVKAIGSPEPLFIFSIITSFYFFKNAFSKLNNNLFFKDKSIFVDLFLAGIFGAIAQITKSPGILLFIGYEIFLFYKLFVFQKEGKGRRSLFAFFIKITLPLLLIPFSVLLLFYFYKIQTGDFFAYFHSGDNFHLVFPPFQGLSQKGSWLGDFWREDMVWQYLIGALAAITLFKKKLYDLASFAGAFFAATLFVAHRDLARYSLPLVPFTLIAFDELIQKKEFKIALLIILPAIYLYSVNFISGNTAPVADWAPYL